MSASSTLQIAEKVNVANILISNLVNQAILAGRESYSQDISQDTKDGFNIASKQLSNFIEKLIEDSITRAEGDIITLASP